jgi:hypothetical protein
VGACSQSKNFMYDSIGRMPVMNDLAALFPQIMNGMADEMNEIAVGEEE